MHRSIPTVLALAMAVACAESAPPYDVLEAELRDVVAEAAPNEVGVALLDPATNTYVGIGDTVTMHAASTMKVPVLLELFRQAEAGRFDMDDSVVVRNEFTSIADGSTYSLSLGEDSDDVLYGVIGGKATYRELARLMIVRSSNLATNILIEIVDADSVAALMDRIGAEGMQVLRGVEDMPAFRRGMNNRTTARALARVLEVIERCEVTTRASCDAMIEILKGQEFNDKIPAGLPPGTPVAHKTGWISGIDHDGAIVYPPDREPYILVVLTRGFEDDRAQAKEVAAETSRLVWQALTGDR